MIVVKDGKLIAQSPVCESTAEALANLNEADSTAALKTGICCSLEEGVQAARELLRQSRAPLFFGMGGMGTNSQRAAIQLAERLGGIIDPGGSPLARASLLALQRVGLSTCSLGEIKQRADVILIWGADPMMTHPRLLERLKISRDSRTVIVLDQQRTATASIASQFIPLAAEDQLDAITALRLLLKDNSVTPSLNSKLPWEQLRELAGQMRSCRYGTILFGEGLAKGHIAELNVESLYRLVEELCSHTRFTARALGESTAENVLAWQTGYAQAVDFHAGFPQSLPGEFSANELIERRDTDCAVILGSQSLTHLSAVARKVLADIPTILIQPVSQRTDFQPTVQLMTAVDGIHLDDTIYRFDDIALPLRQLIKTTLPSVASVLHSLA